MEPLERGIARPSHRERVALLEIFGFEIPVKFEDTACPGVEGEPT
jgi:hypothetical protein